MWEGEKHSLVNFCLVGVFLICFTHHCCETHTCKIRQWKQRMQTQHCLTSCVADWCLTAPKKNKLLQLPSEIDTWRKPKQTRTAGGQSSGKTSTPECPSISHSLQSHQGKRGETDTHRTPPGGIWFPSTLCQSCSFSARGRGSPFLFWGAWLSLALLRLGLCCLLPGRLWETPIGEGKMDVSSSCPAFIQILRKKEAKEH